MNENVIIELKQVEGTKVQSGEFLNNLAKPITIYDQDQIALNKVFIDTEAQTDALIDIPFDIEIHTQQILSITNDNLLKFASFSDGGNNIDNVEYYISHKTSQPLVDANMLQINGLDVQPDNFDIKTVGDPDFPNNPIEFTYTDLADKTRTVHLAFPQKKYPVRAPFITEFDFTLFVKQVANPETDQDLIFQVVQTPENIATCKKLNFPSKIGKQNSQNNPMLFLFQAAGAGVFTKAALTPFTTDFRMVIEKGKYLAQDLCTLINNRMSQNNHGATFPIGNSISSPFLVNSADFSGANFTLVANLGAQGLALADMRTANVNNNFFIGTNQIELSYNSVTGKFFFNFMHFPVYTQNGEISTRLIEVNNNIFAQQTRNGTIGFTSMDAINNETQEPFDFWDTLLGFNVGAMVVNMNHNIAFDDNTTEFIAEIPTVLDTINTTNAKIDLDSMVNKVGADYNYQKVGVQAGVANPAPFIQNNFNSVVEARSVVVSEVSSLTIPYFLIEMNAGFKNNLISTERTSSTIQGIIDRYYSKGSYTMGGDNSLTYTHRGQPLVLSKFHTRILQPDRTVPARLGDDNTIFIEIIRNNEFYLFQRQLEMQQELEAQRGDTPRPRK